MINNDEKYNKISNLKILKKIITEKMFKILLKIDGVEIHLVRFQYFLENIGTYCKRFVVGKLEIKKS